MTLVELMVVLAIGLILLGLGTSGIGHLRANYDLTSATNELYADLEWVRQRSMGSANQFGIQFTQGNYTVFEDRDGNEAFNPGEELMTQNLRNINLSNYPPGSGTLIYSRKGTPNPDPQTWCGNNECPLTLTHPNAAPRQIDVSMFKVRIR